MPPPSASSTTSTPSTRRSLGVVADSDPDASYRDVTEAALAAAGLGRRTAAARPRVPASTAPRSSTGRGSRISPRTASTTTPSTATRWCSPTATTAFRRGLAVGLDIRLDPCRHARALVGGRGHGHDRDHGTFTADNAVVTVPVGVLQSDDFVIEPPLPEPVAGALGRLEMNAFEKVFLRFPTKFWDDGVYAIRQQGRREPLVALLVRPDRAARHADAADLRRGTVRPWRPATGTTTGRRLGPRAAAAALRRQRRAADARARHPTGRTIRSPTARTPT